MTRVGVRCCDTAVALFALVLLFPAVSVFGQDAAEPTSAKDFKPGDRVEVSRGRQWLAGTVVKSSGLTNLVRVELDPYTDRDLPERLRVRDYPADRVRHVRRKQAASRTEPATPSTSTSPSLRPAGGETMRTWTDSTGQHKVEARFQGKNGNRVMLERADGRVVELPISRLSTTDQKYVADIMSGSGDNPFDNFVDSASAPDSGTAGRALSGNGGGLMKANWRNVRNVRPKEFTKWTFQPPAPSSVKRAPTESFMTATLQELPDSDRFFEKVLGLFASPSSGEAILIRQQGVVGNDRQVYLEVANLHQQESESLIPLPAEMEFLDGFGPGGLIMYRPEARGFGNESVLHIDRIENGRLVPYASWEPYAHEDWDPRKDIENAWFLDADRVMTLNHSGSALTIWEVATATAKFSIPIKNAFRLKLAFDRDRTLMATATDDKIAIIDLVNGEHVATIPTNEVNYGSLVFRPNNQQLAGVANQALTVWDLNTGEIDREFGHSALRSTEELAWPGDFVLVDSRYLFDINRRILLWEYNNSLGHATKSTFVDGCLVFAPHSHNDNVPATVNAVALPHPEAVQLAERLGSPEDLLALKPGDEVSIELDIDPGVAPEAEIRESLKSGVETAGFKVVDRSRNIVTAICKQQEQQTIRINIDNRWPVRERDIQQRTITPHASYVKITVDGKVVWSVGYIARPGHMIWMQEGESLDDALQRLTKPNVELIKNVRFAPYIARQGNAGSNGAYGISNLTSAGITTSGDAEAF